MIVYTEIFGESSNFIDSFTFTSLIAISFSFFFLLFVKVVAPFIKIDLLCYINLPKK